MVAWLGYLKEKKDFENMFSGVNRRVTDRQTYRHLAMA